MPDYCPYSGKLIYPRQHDAWRVIRAQQRFAWRKTHKTRPPDVRPYRCPFCRQWHLGTHVTKPLRPPRRAWHDVDLDE